MLALPRRDVKFRVLADDGRTPILVESELFAAPAQRMPESWVAKVSEDGELEIAPERWIEPGYWERFFNQDIDAIATFEEELSAMSSND